MDTGIQTTHSIDLSNRLFGLIVVIMIGTAIFLVGYLWYQFQALPQNNPHEVSVSGEGKAYARPDIALINFGTNTQGLKSQDVVNQNNTIMNAVIQSVKDLGVEDKDIQTTLYHLTPTYDYTEKGRIFKGYSLDQQIQVKIRDFDKISDILDKAASRGATTIGDLQFTVDDMEKFQTEARAKAIAQAKQKAMDLVSQSGIHLGALVNVSEGYAPTPLPLYNQGFGGTAVRESAPQIQTGQMEVDSMVTLTYQVK